MSLNVFDLSIRLSHESGVQVTLVHDCSMSDNTSIYSSRIYSTLSEGGSLFHIYSSRTTNA